MRHAAFLLALWISLPHLINAQTFEAVSLHPLAPGAKADSTAGFAALDPSRPSTDSAPTLLVADFTVFDLLVCAYDIRDAGLHPALEKQLPDWAKADEFHVSARIAPGATVGQTRIMLQALLRDRFSVISHEEIKASPVYLLTVDAKQPLKLAVHTHPCNKDNPCGVTNEGADGALQVKVVGQTLDEMAQEVGGYVWYWAGLHYGPVVNATALKGRYDGMFTFTPIFKADAPTVTTLPDALRHDLGLTLIKDTRPVPQRIIDHLEHPAFD